MTVIIFYEIISPAVLAYLIKSRWNCITFYRELDEESFEISIDAQQSDLPYIEDFLGRYV